MSHRAYLLAERNRMLLMLEHLAKRRADLERSQTPPRQDVAFIAFSDQLERTIRDALLKIDSILPYEAELAELDAEGLNGTLPEGGAS